MLGQPITKELIVALGIPLLLGQIVGVLQGRDTFVWFKTLKKPSWCPPAPVFPVAWTVLYATMGYASFLVWQYGGFEVQQGPLVLYGVQLALNLLWPILFFKQKNLKVAMVENLALLASASVTAVKFSKVDTRAGRLFIPYLLWLILANALNLYIARHNESASEDPKFQDLYHSDDKQNPGQQGYKSAQACLQISYAPQSSRNRGRLQIIASKPNSRAASNRAVLRSPSVAMIPSAAALTSRRSVRLTLI